MNDYNKTKIKAFLKKIWIQLGIDPAKYKNLTPIQWDAYIAEFIKYSEEHERSVSKTMIEILTNVEDKILDDFNDKKIDKAQMEEYMKQMEELKVDNTFTNKFKKKKRVVRDQKD